jgi:DNA-directed RNA polymerase subunit RPC12/RpoP
MDSKKIATVVVLLAVVAVAVVMGIRRMGSRRPEWVEQEQVTKIDRDTLEVVKLPWGQWESLGYRDVDHQRKYKNPKSGKYCMEDAIICARCGKEIPMPLQPPEVWQAKDMGTKMAIGMKVQAEYKCPRCGQNPYRSQTEKPSESGK